MIRNIIVVTNTSGRPGPNSQHLEEGGAKRDGMKEAQQSIAKLSSFDNDPRKPPSSVKRVLKYSRTSQHHKSNKVPLPALRISSASKASKHIRFDNRINWEVEIEKTERRVKESERAKRKQREILQRRFPQDETFLFLIIADIDILVQQFSHSDEVRQLLEDIFKYYRIYPTPADRRSELYPRCTLLRAKARSVPLYRLSLAKQFQNWSRLSGEALLTLPSLAPPFSESQKRHTQLCVFYHLKHTIPINDLMVNYHSEEQELFQRCLQWFFCELRKSLERRRYGIKVPYLTQGELMCGFTILHSENICFDDMNEILKSILFLMGGMPPFLYLFD